MASKKRLWELSDSSESDAQPEGTAAKAAKLTLREPAPCGEGMAETEVGPESVTDWIDKMRAYFFPVNKPQTQCKPLLITSSCSGTGAPSIALEARCCGA